MKECGRCGFLNNDERQFCEKCNRSLFEIRSTQASIAGDRELLLKTRKAKQVDIVAWDDPSSSAPKEPATPGSSSCICPECGYLRRANQLACPNCNYEENKGIAVFASQVSVRSASDIPLSTEINPWIESSPTTVPKHKAVLVRIPRKNEQGEIRIQSFEGTTEHILTRELVDKDNESISSRSHAAIACKDGVWSIENLSRSGTTFKQVSCVTPLEHGDMILLGNRLFRFEIE